jgi:PPOX class probable F420-dependent enzyme
MAIDPRLKKLATGKNFAAMATLTKDGGPSTHVMWVHADDDHLLINTEVHRAKYQRVQRDPRVAVTVWDAANPYSYVEARGHVVGEVRGADARASIDEMSRKYTGKDYDDAAIRSERVLLRIAVDDVWAKDVD